MKLTELQDILGKELKEISDSDRITQEQASKADAIARLAKQMINNSDVVLRADKLIDEGKLKNSHIKELI